MIVCCCCFCVYFMYYLYYQFFYSEMLVDAPFQRCTKFCACYFVEVISVITTRTVIDFVNLLTFLSTLIVIMTPPVFSFIAAESRQTSGHRSRVFPQIFARHWCPSARKVCDVNATLRHGCLCLQMHANCVRHVYLAF